MKLFELKFQFKKT